MTADRLLLWRHGRTAHNTGDRFQGQLDAPLDDVGRVQVKEAAEVLAGLLDGVPWRLVSSDLSRAHDTARALADLLDVPITLDRQVREVDAGRWEGLPRPEVQTREPALFDAWLAGEDIRVGGAERRSEAGVRTACAVLAHAGAMDGGTLVVASHGTALRGAIRRLIGITEWGLDLVAPLRNAHWADLRRWGDGWLLDAYNVGPLQRAAGAEG